MILQLLTNFGQEKNIAKYALITLVKQI